jgi:predicted enzyme related to lactoylglutathione lyase
MKLDSAVFYTNDLEAVATFYAETLGFKEEYRQGDKYISFIFPNDARLGIKKAVEERESPGAQAVFIEVENIQELFKQLKAKKLVFLKDLVEQEWGSNFSIADPDGNKVQFVQKAK